MPILVRSRQPRCLQSKDSPHLAHRHIADQGLEVRAGGGGCSRLAEVPVEDSDLLLVPAQR
jgi:hypothetical protein